MLIHVNNYVELEGGERFPADLVLLGIGVAPDTELARRAGLALGVKGAISVDGQMRTSAPDVYAVGDAVEVRHFVTGAKSHIALAGPANKQKTAYEIGTGDWSSDVCSSDLVVDMNKQSCKL